MKTLYLLRHAKAEPGGIAVADEDRPLAARGREACQSIGRYMRAKAYSPERVLCSTSARTRETLALVAASHGTVFAASYEKKLYLSTATEMLGYIHACEDAYASLMLVGHNPGMHHLAALLVSGEHTRLREKLEIKYPTGTLAVITFHVNAWRAVVPDAGTLTDMVIPKELDA